MQLTSTLVQLQNIVYINTIVGQSLYPVKDPYCIVVKTQEDPAIVICLKEGAIHMAMAMALPHAPCRQGATATESGEIFSEWLYKDLCSAIPLSPEINGLYCSGRNNVPTCYREILMRLNNRQVAVIEMRLSMQFNQDPVPAGSIPEWSHNCETQGFHLGHVFVIGRQGIDLIPSP